MKRPAFWEFNEQFYNAMVLHKQAFDDAYGYYVKGLDLDLAYCEGGEL